MIVSRNLCSCGRHQPREGEVLVSRGDGKLLPLDIVAVVDRLPVTQQLVRLQGGVPVEAAKQLHFIVNEVGQLVLQQRQLVLQQRDFAVPLVGAWVAGLLCGRRLIFFFIWPKGSEKDGRQGSKLKRKRAEATSKGKERKQKMEREAGES